MFGFVTPNPMLLSDEARKRYKSVYCGVCECLGQDRKNLYRFALTYDFAFLALMLSAVSGEEFSEYSGRCPVHPARKRTFLVNELSSYAADMNIALAYYKYLDDKKDDNSLSAALKARLTGNEAEKISGKFPVQCEKIISCLERLDAAERENVLIPDVPACIFGELLGSIFVYEGNGKSINLYDFGFALGKFIYVMDAAVDLKKDLKKGKYNPLIRCSSEHISAVLDMLMAECVNEYKKLTVVSDSDIIENILFSGVWMKYPAKKKGREKTSE